MSENTDRNMIMLASYPRAIVHIDGDAFFASCEQAQDPSLKGRPVVTGKERGIISSASYEAKALGIKRGVSLYDAKKICPALVVLPSDYETYSIYSERMFNIIRRFTPDVEEFSIDEAFCDITGLRRIYRASYPAIAENIKRDIQKELGITVSAGISLSKTLAKICSRFKKPDGFTALPGHRLHEFLVNIPLEMVCGFGPNTVSLLTKYGVKNVFDYTKKPAAFAEKMLGKIGSELWRELRGEAVYGICTEKKEKYLSISKSRTFTPPTGNKAYVKAELLRNVESACMKLRRHFLSAGRLAIYLRTKDFKHSGIEAKLNRHTSSTLDFAAVSATLFESVFDARLFYRASGIVFTDILQEGVDSRTLFDDPVKIEKTAKISRTVDEINNLYGKYAVHIAAADPAIKRKENTYARNDLARRKTALLKGETFRKRLNIPLVKLK